MVSPQHDRNHRIEGIAVQMVADSYIMLAIAIGNSNQFKEVWIATHLYTVPIYTRHMQQSFYLQICSVLRSLLIMGQRFHLAILRE